MTPSATTDDAIRVMAGACGRPPGAAALAAISLTLALSGRTDLPLEVLP